MIYVTVKYLLIPTIEPVIHVDKINASTFITTNTADAFQKEKAEKLAKEKAEIERAEKEKREKERIKEEKREKEKLEKEKIAKLAKEKMEREKLEKAQKLAKEKAEKEKPEKEKQRKIEEQTIETEAVYESSGLNNPSPKYPIISKKEGEEGEVILLVKTNANGEVVEVSIYKSSGYKRLDDASVYAVQSWRFIPAKNKFGGSLGSTIKVPFIFKIRGGNAEN